MTDPTPRAVSVSILKGGVGKSTIAVNLTDRLAARGNDVLFVDLDPNGHASMGLGFKDAYHDDQDIGGLLFDDGDAAPEDVIYGTDYGFDVLPSSNNLEDVEDGLRNATMGDVRVRNNVIDPLLGDAYDYIVTDSPAYRGKLTDNALIATENIIIPLVPGNEALAGFQRTMERQIKPLREYIDLDILSIVPNRLSQRIDQQNNDRVLVEKLNQMDTLSKYVPEFARLSDDEFDRIDRGDVSPLPKPGLRDRGAFTDAFGESKPLGHYDPENDQLEHLETLARIVENGGVDR